MTAVGLNFTQDQSNH